MEYKTYFHSPAHLFVDHAIYFVTGATYLKLHYLIQNQAKDIFYENLLKFISKYGYHLFEWVILNNHYHILFQVQNAEQIPQFVNTLHKTSSYHIKRKCNIKVDKFWFQYYDKCVKDDKQLTKITNYIYYNPVKHKLVNDIMDYKYSSS